jgi:hypothetical protein
MPLPAHIPRAGGCTFVEDADSPVERAHILWSADVDPAVLTVRAEPDNGLNADLFDLAGFGPRAAVALGAGVEHVVIADRGWRLRFDVIAGTVRAGPVQLHHQLVGAATLGPKIAALRQLVAFCRTGHAAPWRARPDPRLPRLIQTLRVIDALADGAGLQEIALGLFGDRAADDWPGAGESVKSRVRRLVALARALQAAGPRAILLREI